MLHEQRAAIGAHAPLQLARHRRAAPVHDARRPIPQHVFGCLDDLGIRNVRQVHAEREMADALEIGVQLRRMCTRDAALQPVAVAQRTLRRLGAVEQHLGPQPQELRELARAEHTQKLQQRPADVLPSAHVERREHLGIVDAMRHPQRAQHPRQLAVGTERQHMDRARAHLRAVEGLGGEAAARVGQALDHHHPLPAPQKLRGRQQATQPRPDDDDVVVALAHVFLIFLTSRSSMGVASWWVDAGRMAKLATR